MTDLDARTAIKASDSAVDYAADSITPSARVVAKATVAEVATEAAADSPVDNESSSEPAVIFREMLAADLPEVMRVESACYDFPWSEKNFHDCMKAGYLCYVAECVTNTAAHTKVKTAASSAANTAVKTDTQAGAKPDSQVPVEAGQLAAHGILMLGPGEAHVLNLCVHPSRRRHGLARKFLQHLLDSARQHEAREVFLEVRESNQAAISLYETTGFNQLTVRRGYYDSNVNDGGREDALIYAMTIRPLNQVKL